MGYNLAAEYAVLAIILMMLISFVKDYENKQPVNRFLRAIYFISLISSISTIVAIELDGPTNSGFLLCINQIVHYVYFATLPALTSLYLAFCVFITSAEADYQNIKKSLAWSMGTYIIYIAIIISNIFTGVIFQITKEAGYARGTLYQAPYYLAGINIILIVMVILKNRHSINPNTKSVILLNMIIGGFVLIIQSMNSYVIMTGLCNTISIMAIHLYTQNQKKSVDQLTSVQNVVALRYNLEAFLKKEEEFSLYIISMRGFKSINERNGLEFGDNVLQMIAKQILHFIPYKSVYRYGGDEFAVLLKTEGKNERLIQGLLKYITRPINILNIDEVNLDVVCARVDNKLFGKSVKELISSADYSISILKQTHGEPRYLYDPTVVHDIIANTKMIRQIKEAIDNRKFKIYYQPMYSSKDKCFTQAEALVRMIDEDGKTMSPAEFIEIAENTGLITPMTFVILDIVCEDYRRLLDLHGIDVWLNSVSVNFPYNVFLTPGVEDHVMKILSKYDITPDRIKIEITERTFISNDQVTKDIMESMRRRGFVFELDDFGVDYSNMSTFLNLPMQIIKIDRSVLLSAMVSEKNKRFYQHLMQGIVATERIIIVEGVEDKEQLDFVLKHGCEYVQGYIFSKPLEFDKFSEFIKARNQTKYLEEFFGEKVK